MFFLALLLAFPVLFVNSASIDGAIASCEDLKHANILKESTIRLDGAIICPLNENKVRQTCLNHLS